MATKPKVMIRIMMSNWEYGMGCSYRHLYFDILKLKWDRYYESIGMITWQTDKDNWQNGKRWYAISAKIDTCEVDNLKKMLSVLTYIKKMRIETPQEFMQHFKVEEFQFGKQLSEYIPVSKSGWVHYKIKSGSTYCKGIIAKDSEDAHAQLAKYAEGCYRPLDEFFLEECLPEVLESPDFNEG